MLDWFWMVINMLYTIDEVKEKYGLYGDFSFVLETDGYTTFGEYLKMPAVRNYDFSDYRYGKATHGYLPEKGPQPTFVGCGPSFKNGYSVKDCSMLDHASTFAQIFGFEFKNGKGKKWKEFNYHSIILYRSMYVSWFCILINYIKY